MSAPAVAVAADGKQYAAVWKDVRTGENRVYWAISDQPHFSQDAPVYPELRGEQNHPSVAIDSAGTVWVVWEESRPDGQRIWIRSSAAGDRGRALSDADDGWASFPVVVANAGRVAVVYEAEKGGETTVMFRTAALTQE